MGSVDQLAVEAPPIWGNGSRVGDEGSRGGRTFSTGTAPESLNPLLGTGRFLRADQESLERVRKAKRRMIGKEQPNS